MHIEMTGKSDIGKKRAANEDAFGIDADQMFLVVADGVGGLQAGQVASQLAVQEITQYLQGHPLLPEQISAAIQHANTAIYQAALSDPDCATMATTVNVVTFSDDHVHIAHIGDSRTYRFRHGKLERLTEDHNVRTFLAKGWITPEQVDDRISQEALLRALGMEPSCIVDIQTTELVAQDLWLTATDGLFGMVPHARMEEILAHNLSDLPLAATTLVQEANANGGRDNITVVLAYVHTI